MKNEVRVENAIEVMVVDDTTANLKLLSAILSHEGYTVKVANSGLLALSAIALKAPDLILLDIVMPEVDGYEVCRQLKANQETSEIPVIFITVHDSIEEKVKAFQVGAVDYITKPFEEREILMRIKTHLELHKLRKDAVTMNELLRAEILEKQNLYDALSKAKQDIEIAYAEKWDVLANMAHEIRTPMNSILVAVQIIQMSDLSEDQKELMCIAMTSSENLLNLLNNILERSKINANLTQFERESVNIEALLKAVIDLFGIICIEKAIDLELIIDDCLPTNVWGDAFRLRQVVTNLVGNAVKFTQKGFVKVQVKILENLGRIIKLEFSVADTGMGVPISKQKLIFDRFQQVDRSTARTYGGTGLGLSISKEYVDKMAGEIWVESVEGQGSTFKFTCVFECCE